MFLEYITLASLGPWRRTLPPLLPEQVIPWVEQQWGVRISVLQLIIIGVSIGLMVLLDFVVGRTQEGMAMRAISYDQFAVPMMGVPVNRIISLTFAIGSALAAAGGTLFSTAYPIIEPMMGMMIGWKAFIAAVVGGIGSIRGAVVGAFILGLVEIGTGAIFPSRLRDLLSFAVVWIILMIKPTGIFGVARRQKV